MKKTEKPSVATLAVSLANGLGMGAPVKIDLPTKPEKKPATRKSRAKKPKAETPPANQPATVPVETPKPERKPEAKKPASLAEMLLSKAKKFDGAVISAGLRESKDIIGNPELVSYFAGLIRNADEIGVDKLAFDMSPRQAEDEWFRLTLSQIQSRLQDWAAGNETIGELLASLRDFQKNNFVGDALWEIITDIDRACGLMRSEGDLLNFLRRMARDNLVVAITNPRHEVEDGVSIRQGATVFAFVPKEHGRLTKVQAGWHLVQECHAKIGSEATKWLKRVADLKGKAKLTRAQALQGKEGTVFGALGTMRGILFEVRGKGDEQEARIVEVIDVKAGELPSKWFRVTNKDAWSNPDIVRTVASLRSL